MIWKLPLVRYRTLLAAVLLPLALTGTAAGASADRLAAIVTGAGAHLECAPSPAAWTAEATRLLGDAKHGGLFTYESRRMILRADVCYQLRQIPGLQESISAARAVGIVTHAGLRQVGFAVYVLAHELQHAVGVIDESAADCGAARSFVQIAERLGAGRAFAGALLAASAPVDGYVPARFAACVPPATT